MTPVKTWFLLHLSVLFIAPTVSEVVQSMKQCGEFLLLDKAPEVPGILEKGQIKSRNRYKVICQTYKNEKRFVTLYDTKNKIPVFSASKFRGAEKGKRQREEPSMMEPQTYNNVRRFVTLYDTKNKIPVLSASKFRGAEEGRPNVPWKMEPQLEDMNNDKNMKTSSKTEVYNNQAGDKDYKGSGYDRGHLFPSSYAKNTDDKISTFTLTNVVPQAPTFNQGSWRKMEESVKSIMKRNCINNGIKAYVMIGAKPSVKNKIKDRVNVPSLLWSAFCCYNKKQNKWIAGAYWGENINDKTAHQTLHPRTLGQLYEKLSDGDKRFKAFPGPKCPLDQTYVDLDT